MITLDFPLDKSSRMRKKMNSGFTKHSLIWPFSIWPLHFWYLSHGSLINEKSIFNFAPGLISIGPLNYSTIYKTVIGFWIIQFGSSLTLQLLILSKLPLEKSIKIPKVSLKFHFGPWTLISCNFALHQPQTLVFIQLSPWVH